MQSAQTGSLPAQHAGADSASERSRSRGLDGLRGLAALSIVSFHAWLYGFGDAPVPRHGAFNKLLFETRIGLVCFFVLSGFLLYRSFARAALGEQRPVRTGRYALRRAARIMPAYYASLAGTLLLLWGATDTPGVRMPAAEGLPLFALFGQNYSLDTAQRVNPVTWTLCIEVTFYLLLPLLGLLALRLGPKRVAHQAALLVSLIALTVGWNWLVHAERWSIVASKSLPAYSAHFALGMLVALWTEQRRRGRREARLPGWRSMALALAGFAIVAANGYWHATAPPRAVYAPLAVFADLPAALGFALVIAAAAGGSGPLLRWLGWRPLASIGLISYGIYLWHVPLLLFTRRIGVLPDGLVPRFLLVLVLASAVAWLSWTLLERPFIRWAADRARMPRLMRRADAQAAP